jgi:hypothetical protein
MTRAMRGRGVMVGAAAAMMVGLAASPASAANLSVDLPNGRGYMRFVDSGDHFTVCDTKADGHGVTGYLRTTQGSRIVIVRTWDDGGDAGCDGGTHDIIGGRVYDMLICWNGGGPCVVSPVFSES